MCALKHKKKAGFFFPILIQFFMIFCINGFPFSFLSLSLSYPHSSTSLQMSHLPPGCARVLSGWCHGCAWDDDLWLRVRPCSLLFLPPNTSLKWGWEWGWLMDGPLLFPVMLTWADLCQDVILSPVIIYFTKDVNFEQKKRDLFRRTSDYIKDSNYLNWIFCTVFLSAKHRGQQSVWRNSTWTVLGLILQLCVSLAHGGLAVLPDWLWWFLLPPPVCTVQYFLLTWCLQQNVQAMTVDGDWNMQKGGQNHNMPSSFQSLWIISEIKCFYLFQVNCKVSRMSVSFRWITRLIFFYSIYLSLGIRLNWVLCL